MSYGVLCACNVTRVVPTRTSSYCTYHMASCVHAPHGRKNADCCFPIVSRKRVSAGAVGARGFVHNAIAHHRCRTYARYVLLLSGRVIIIIRIVIFFIIIRIFHDGRMMGLPEEAGEEEKKKTAAPRRHEKYKRVVIVSSFRHLSSVYRAIYAV